MTVVLSLWRGVIDSDPQETARRTTMGQILMETAIKYGLTVHDLRGPSRKREHSHPRQEAMWLMHATGRFTLPQMGRFLGGRDHTTILHGIRAHTARMGREGALAA